MQRKLFLGTLVVFALMVIAACGGGSESSSDEADQTEAAATTAAAGTEAATEETAPPETQEAAATEEEAEPLKIAFVYYGEIEDGGWNQSHEEGRLYLEENVPNVETVAIPGIDYGEAAQKTLDDLAAEGYDIIVSTADYSAETGAVAPDYPDTTFLTVFGTAEGPNIGNYMVSLEDGRYIDGIIAGLTTESDIIGYVGGYAIPVVVRPLDAFTRGVHAVNPDAVVKAVWVNSWYDPPKERQAAEALADQGADVLGMDLNSPAVPTVAEKRGLGFVGYGYDRQESAPNSWLSSFLFDWGPYYAGAVEQIRDGSWQPGLWYGGFDDGVLDMAPFGPNVSAAAAQQAEDARAAIESGSLDVFSGPVVDNEGNTVIAEGETLDEAARFSCCDWLIEGVEGTIPAS
jgi:basic membrane protein A